jgi:hypothetical protein
MVAGLEARFELLFEGRKCGWGSGLGCAEDDDIVVGKLGSEADVGRVPARLCVGRVELRMEGRRIRVGGAAATICDVVAVDIAQELDEDDGDSVGSSMSFLSSFVFLELGLGGGLSASSSSRGFPAGIPL